MTLLHPTIALLHATPVAIAPIHTAFAQVWPEATLTNLLDDGLTRERAKTADLTDVLTNRFIALARYAHDTGHDAVLATCSAFGIAIEAAQRQLPIPVLKPNEAMFMDAIAHGKNIGMLATFEPSVASMEAEFHEIARRNKVGATLRTILVNDAIERLREGDMESHNALIAEKASALRACDAVVLAHFSTSHALASVRSVLTIPVFAAPTSAVLALRHRMGF